MATRDHCQCACRHACDRDIPFLLQQTPLRAPSQRDLFPAGDSRVSITDRVAQALLRITPRFECLCFALAEQPSVSTREWDVTLSFATRMRNRSYRITRFLTSASSRCASFHLPNGCIKALDLPLVEQRTLVRERLLRAHVLE